MYCCQSRGRRSGCISWLILNIVTKAIAQFSLQIGAASQEEHSISMPFYSSIVKNASGKKLYLCLYNCKCISQMGFLLNYLTCQLFPKQFKIVFFPIRYSDQGTTGMGVKIASSQLPYSAASCSIVLYAL